MLASSYISPKAVKGRPSTIEGRGLVAVAPIAADEIVAIKGGHIVDTATLQSLPERLRNSDVQIADGFHLVASCRRIINGRAWQRPDLQRKYRKYFSWYLLRRFNPSAPNGR
jgi:hypothetical protein